MALEDLECINEADCAHILYDYAKVPNFTVTVPAGTNTFIEGSFPLTPYEDTIDEGDGETVNVTGYYSVGAVPVPVTGTTLTINDNDDPPTEIELSVTPASVAEGAVSTEVTVTATVKGDSTFGTAQDVTVEVGGVPGDTAAEGTDYATVDDFTLTIPVGDETADGTFNLSTTYDEVAGGTGKTLSVLGTLSGVTVTGTELTITDADTTTVSVTGGSADEGSAVTFTVSLGSEITAANDVSVDFVTSNGTAMAGSDYTAVSRSGPNALTIAAGENSTTVTVPTLADSIAEGDETFTATISNVTGQTGVTLDTTAASSTGTIVDDAEDAAAARQNRVNEEVLPRMAQAMAASTLSAVTGRIDAAVSGAAPAGLNLAGRSSLYHALKSNARALEDGTLNLTQVLGGSSFALPLSAAEDGGADGGGEGSLRGLAVWGRGDYRKLSGAEDGTVEWDGDIVSFHLGADMRVRPDLLAGLALSRSRGSFDYTDRTDLVVVGGSYESRMTSVHPYVNWSSPEGLGLWATVGYGEGEIEILDDVGGRESSDTNMKTAAVGASGKLLSDDDVLAGGTTALRLKGEGSLARVEVEGNGRINPLTSDVQRLRLSLEGSHERQFASGGRLTPSVEVGLRHDGGDAITGAGLEVGGALRYVDAASGLTLEGRGRVLLAHEEDYEDWGIGGLVRVDPGAEGRGLSFSLFPAWGDTASGVDRLWDQEFAELATDDTAANDNVPQMRLDGELGYGFGAFGGRGLLTPYGGFSLAGEGSQRYRIGSRFEIGPSLDLSLEGARREPANDDAAEHGVMLRLQASW